ncbi:MAG: hypothetical protein K8R53_07635 [Bacteroidales bacterium]|nr:hypothetical protein [Bacteroidales bacterium]
MKRFIICISLIFLLTGTFCSFGQVIGVLNVESPDGPLNLPVVTEQKAINTGNGVVKIALDNGLVGAADLVSTSDPEASPVRIQTPYGTRAWRKINFDLYARAYGGTGTETGRRIVVTGDGGLALGGYTRSYGAGVYDMLFLKLNENGSLQWANAYGYSSADYLFGMCQTSDGGYFLTGKTYNGGGGLGDVDYKKIDSNGNLSWEFWNGTTDVDGNYDVIQNSEGGFTVCNFTKGFGAGDSDVWIRKMDASGGSIWGYYYGGADYDIGYAIVENSAGGYAIAGATESAGAGLKDLYFFTIDNSGSTEHIKVFGGVNNDVANDLIQDSDGNYVLAGYTGSFGAGYDDFYIKKLDGSGSNIWGYAFGGTLTDRAYSIIETADQGYAICGYTSSFSVGNQDLWLVKLNKSGQYQWSWSFGAPSAEFGYEITEGADDNIYAVGSTSSIGAGQNDFLLVKFTYNGISCLVESLGDDDFVALSEYDFHAFKVEDFVITKIDNDFTFKEFQMSVIPEKNILSGSYSGEDVTPVTPTITTICD